MSANRIPVVVFGGAGYGAGEFLRLLAGHPGFSLAAAASESQAGKAISEVHPHMHFGGDMRFVTRDSAQSKLVELAKSGAEPALVLAMGHGRAMEVLPAVLDETGGSGFKVIDLSGDFRLESAADHEKAYGKPHGAPELCGRFVYGLCEANKEAIAGADMVANPGCFATAVELALLPLASADLLKGAVSVSAYTGSSGSGALAKQTTHHPARAGNLFAYKPLVHQHVPEMVQALETAGGTGFRIDFVPHSAPIVRGILVTAFVTIPESVDAGALYRDRYGHSPFVTVCDSPPQVGHLAGSNRCAIGLTRSGDTLVVMAAIDNLGKGAAGQLTQNLNIMYGLEEWTGLENIAIWPH